MPAPRKETFAPREGISRKEKAPVPRKETSAPLSALAEQAARLPRRRAPFLQEKTAAAGSKEVIS